MLQEPHILVSFVKEALGRSRGQEWVAACEFTSAGDFDGVERVREPIGAVCSACRERSPWISS